MTKKSSPTDEELDRGLGHVQYEIRQFLEAARALRGDYIVLAPRTPSQQDTDTDWVVLAAHNSFTESFLIHARNLVDFLCEKNRKKQDDILASDYYEPGDCFQPEELKVVSAYRTDINKRLAHLTYYRSPVFPWPTPSIAREVLACCRAFIQHILVTHLRSATTEQISAYQELLVDINHYLQPRSP